MRPAPLLLFALTIGSGIGSSSCKDSDDDDGPVDTGSTDLGPKSDGGVDTGVDSGTDVDTGVGSDAGGEDAGRDDLGRPDAGSGPGVVMRLFGLNGDPLSGASIEVAGGTHTADGDGIAFIPGLAGEQVFVLGAAGHQRTPMAYSIPASARVLIDATLAREVAPTTLDDSAPSMVNGARSLARFPADSLETEGGADITGSYQARLLRLDTSVEGEVLAAPMPFVGIDDGGASRRLEIFAIFEIQVTQAGAPLVMKAGQPAAIDVVLPDEFEAAIDPMGETIPAWSYDEASGRWVQEMDGVAGPTPFGELIWSGSFTHFSWWAIARPFDGACLEARTVGALPPMPDAPVEGALVRAIGLDHGYLEARFTDAEGDTCVEIKPGGNVVVSAIHEGYASLANPVTATGNVVPAACGGAGCMQAPLTLEGAGCAAGVVLDGQGAPYPNARIQVRHQNNSEQLVSSFTPSDAGGRYCAQGPIGRGGSVIATDAAFTDTATAGFGDRAMACGAGCGAIRDLILAEFVGGCFTASAIVYNGADNPPSVAPEGTPVHIYSGADFTPSCAPGEDDPSLWGTLAYSTTVDEFGRFCASQIPFGPTLVILGDCTTWPSDQCGPVPSGGSPANRAVCGQPGCVDLGTVRYNMVCDGGS